MRLDLGTRLLILFLVISANLAFLILLIFSVNFTLNDDNNNLDRFHLTRLNRNELSYICDYFDCTNNGSLMKFVINILALFLMWLQYLLINNRDLRMMMIDFYPSSVFYIKIVTKFFTFFSFIMLIVVYQPMDEIIVYNINFGNYITNFEFFLWGIRIYGIFLIFNSLRYHLGNDVMGYKLFMDALLNRDIDYPQEYLFDYTIAFKLCRSPLRSAILCLFLGGNSIWDLGKLLFFSFLFVGLYADSVSEEVYLKNAKLYPLYQKSVTTRFLPNLKNILYFKMKTE